ncbi:4-coumarate--CoA ligase family protein [Leucobacter zeae]|nr:4-coumarate--CoA ligase family protein [Leucobacter zeae]
MTYASSFPALTIPDQSVYEYVFGGLLPEDLERVAVIDGPSGAETTYGQLRGQVLAIAGSLAARGIGVGDVVALHAPNVPAFVSAFHGILRSGATVTTVTALSTAAEIERQLRDSGATLLITVSPLLAASGPGAEAAGVPADRIVVMDGVGAEADPDGHPNLRDLLASGAPAPEVDFDPATHLAAIPYSSGTTGRPKGVMLTHTNLVANVLQTRPALTLDSHDRVLAVLPFTHIYGLTVLLNLALAHRAVLVTMPRFDLAEFLRTIQDQRTTAVFIAPPIAVALAKHPMVDEYDLSAIEFVLSGAAALDAHLARAVADRLGTLVLQGYGMTEMSPVSHVIPRDRDDIDRGSIGLLVPGSEMRVVDIETGEEVAVPASGRSEPGEMLIRGPQIMAGYLNNPEATAATIEPDGFLHTGDIVEIDATGQVFVVDRLKELIKYKGYQVPPAELEALLLTHPGIADAAVVAFPDDDAGEVPKAFVVRQPGAELSEDEVIAFVADRVAPPKKVRRVEFIDAIPKSASGKILRKDLRARDAA